MAERLLGPNNEVILDGLDQKGMSVIKRSLGVPGVDLEASFFGENGRVMPLRELSALKVGPDYREWVLGIDALYDEMKKTEDALRAANLGIYVLKAVAPVIPNPLYTPPREEHAAFETTQQIFHSGERRSVHAKYTRLAHETLFEINDNKPYIKRLYPKGAQELAVRFTFDEQ